MSRYCPKCFTRLPDKANYCPICGECMKDTLRKEVSWVNGEMRTILVSFSDKALILEEESEREGEEIWNIRSRL